MSIYGFGEGKNKKDTYTKGELDAVFAMINGTLSGLGDTVTEQGQTIAEHTQTIASQGETIAGHTETIASQGETIEEQGETIAEHTQEIAARTFSVISVTIPASSWNQQSVGTATAAVAVTGVKSTDFAVCGQNDRDISTSRVSDGYIQFITRSYNNWTANSYVMVLLVPLA